MDYFAKAASQEVAYAGSLASGARGASVRRLQEWLALNGNRTAIDGSFGDATATALAAFRTRHGLPANPALDSTTWERLVQPMASLVVPAIPMEANDRLSDITLKIAQAHLGARPIEVGGDNCGPWVRAYMSGNEGRSWPWCAGFVTAVVAQAAAMLGVPSPLARTYSSDSLGKNAQVMNRFVRGSVLADDPGQWQALGTCQVFLVRLTANDWTHTGISFAGKTTVFETVEGNTNDAGSPEGVEVAHRIHSIAKKNFISLG